MTARSGELVKTVGHAVNMRYVSAATTLTTEDDLLVYTNSSDINVSVPSGNKYAGKILYMKKIGAGAVTLTGAYFKSQDSQTSTSYRISNSAPRIFIYDGSYWNEFYCGN